MFFDRWDELTANSDMVLIWIMMQIEEFSIGTFTTVE